MYVPVHVQRHVLVIQLFSFILLKFFVLKINQEHGLFIIYIFFKCCYMRFIHRLLRGLGVLFIIVGCTVTYYDGSQVWYLVSVGCLSH